MPVFPSTPDSAYPGERRLITYDVQAILAARREVVAATKAKQQTESQILDLKTQHELQSNPESDDLERLDVEIAELTMGLSALNRQV